MPTPKYKRIISLLLALVLVLGCLPTITMPVSAASTTSYTTLENLGNNTLGIKDGNAALSELGTYLNGIGITVGSSVDTQYRAKIYNLNLDIEKGSTGSTSLLQNNTTYKVTQQKYQWHYSSSGSYYEWEDCTELVNLQSQTVTKDITIKHFHDYKVSSDYDNASKVKMYSGGTELTQSADGTFRAYLGNSVAIEVPVVGGKVVTVTLGNTDVPIDQTTGRSDNINITNINSCDLVVTYAAREQYTLSASVNDSSAGSVTFSHDEDETTDGAQVYNGDSVTLTAKPKDGYEFVRWYKLEDGKMTPVRTDGEAEFTTGVSANANYLAVFKSTSENYVAQYKSSGKKFTQYELAYAINNAASGDTIVLTADATLSENVTIPSGVTLLLPYSDSNQAISSDSDTPYANTTSTASVAFATPGDSYTYRKLTMNEATMTVKGTLVLGGECGSGSSNYSGQTSGAHSDIAMDGDSKIIVDGGIVSSYGYITGGKVEVKNGGKVYEPFVILDFNGGTYTAVSFYTRNVCPFNQYAMLNVQSDMTIDGTSTLYGYAYMITTALEVGDWTISDGYNHCTFPMIGSDGLIRTNNDTTVTMTYDSGRYTTNRPNVGTTNVTISGGVSFATMGLTLTLGTDVTINTANLYFGVPYNVRLSLTEGTYTTDADFKIMPGAEVTVAADATLTVGSGKKLAVYDGYNGHGGFYSTDVAMYPYGTMLTTKGLPETGRLIVNGTLNISDNSTFAGRVETTGETGKIVVGKSAALQATVTEGVLFEDAYSAQIWGVSIKTFSAVASNYTSTKLTAMVYNGTEWETLEQGKTYYAAGDDIVSLTKYSYEYAFGEQETTSPYEADYQADKHGKWVVPQITFVCECESGHGTITVTPEETVGNLPDCGTRTGYTFGGWWTGPGGTGDSYTEETLMPRAAVTLYANWVPNQYTISFNTDGGSAVAPITQNYGTEVTTPANPTKTGYTFTGWDTTIPATMPAEDMNIKAQWMANEYVVTLDPNDGTAITSQIAVTYGSTYDLPTPNRGDGYGFQGWYTNDNQRVQTGDIVELTANITLTAKWEVGAYTIEYNLDGGTATGSNPTSYTAESGDIVLSNPKREGYAFLGWSGTDIEGMAESVTIQAGSTGKRSYTANWKVNQYTITFITDGGSEIAAITQDYGTAVTAPSAPTKTGYTFTGWDNAIPTTMPAQNLTITAKWQINQYTITFQNSDGTVLKTSTQDYGTQIVAPTAPAKTGYTFSGWSGIPSTMPAEDVTVQGSFKANTYTIKFLPNSGSGEMESMTVTYDETVALTACGYTKTGYNFTGWNTAANGSGTSYADQEQIKNLTSVNGAQITLYATWKAKTYDVTLDYNDGVTEAGQVTVIYDGTYHNLPEPIRAGYDFAGWSDGTNPYTTSTPVAEPVPTKLTAQWTAQGKTPYTVYHYQQNLDNDQYTLVETQKLTGATDALATAMAKSDTGFAVNAQSSIASGTIAADGSLELKLYYDRVQYTVTWQVAGKQVQEQYPYGQTPAYDGQKDYEDRYAIYTFTGWDADLAEVTENVTYTALYISSYEASFFNASTGKITLTYARLANALAAATNGQTVRLEDDITLSEDLTVPEGVTLLLPCQDNDTGYNLVNNGQLKFNHDNPGTSGTASLYRTLTVPQGVTLTVEGTVMIDSLSGRKSGGTAEVDITGGYAEIALNGDIVVVNGGVLDCFGYVTGSGKVAAESGGAVGDLYIVRHWRGGSQALEMYQSTITYSDGTSRQTYPMNEYDCHNIETDVVIKYGASYDGMVKMCANAGSGNAYYYTRFPQVDVSNGLIRLTSEDSYVVRSYDETTGEEIYRIYGGANFANSSLTITGVSLPTKDFVYPIDGDNTFELYSGDYHFENDYKFLTGGGMTVYSGASLTVNAGTHVAFYDEFHDPVNTGDTQYPEREQAVLTIKEGGEFTNAGTFGGSIVTESADILVGDDPVWGITTLEANGYTNGTVKINHDLKITRKGYTWRYGESALGEIANSIIWTGADYTELNAALETVPKNLNIYADDIADALEAVLKEIQPDLGMDKQEQVDKWTAKIEEYVSKLKLRVVTVTLDANGGTVKPATMELTYGDPYGTMPEPEYYGFTFKGWYDQDNELITAETQMQETVDNITLTAKWEKLPADYTVVNQAIAKIPAELDCYCAASVNRLQQTLDAVVYDLTADRQADINAWAAAIEQAVRDLEYKTITVYYDPVSGSCDVRSMQVAFGTPPQALPVASQDYYEFLGWYTAKEGGEKIEPADLANRTENQTLYAQYKLLNADYSRVNEILNKIPTDLSCYSDESVQALETAMEQIQEGYTAERQGVVDKWAEQLEAAYEGLTYRTVTITYDPQGGKVSPKSVEVQYSDTITVLPEPEYSYHEFAGWFTEPEGGEQVTAGTQVTSVENFILYAHWTQIDADYTKVYAALEKVPNEEELQYYTDDTVSNLQAAIDAVQYKLSKEYQIQVNNWANDINRAVANLEYKAVTVTFVYNGGTQGELYPSVIRYGSTYGTLPTTTKEGYTFLGWYTANSGGEKVESNTVMQTLEDHSLYAHWGVGDSTEPTTPSTAPTNPSVAPTTPSTAPTNPSVAPTTPSTAPTNPSTEPTTPSTAPTNPTTEPTEPSIEPTVPTTETTKNEDGSVTTTTRDEQGNVTEITVKVDGSVTTVVTQTDGTVKVDVALSEAAVSGANVTLPIQEVSKTNDTKTATAITVTTGSKTPVTVTIPVKETSAGTVAVLVNEDGSEKVISSTVMADDGVVITIPEGATIKIVDNSQNFNDVAKDSWYSDAVDFASSRNLTNGVGNDLFNPDGTVTRAQFVTMLYRLAGEPVGYKAAGFQDVKDGQWYTDAINWAAAEGVTNGYGNGLFGINDEITREQMAAMMYRYAEGENTNHDLSHFNDAHTISDYAVEALAWANANGIINGMGNGTLDPQGDAKRAQAAQILMNYIQNGI